VKKLSGQATLRAGEALAVPVAAMSATNVMMEVKIRININTGCAGQMN
jgi:hypothetical protein